MKELAPLQQIVARTSGRVRLQRALESATAGLAASFAVGCAVRLVRRWLFFRDPSEPLWLAGIAVLASIVAWSWPVRPESIAARIDRAHAFHDRVRTALDFAQRPQRTAFMDAAIHDAVARVGTLSARRAAPFAAPRAKYAALGLGLLWLASGMLPARAAKTVVRVPTAPVVALSQDELSGFREDLTNLEAAAPLSAEEVAARAAYRALLERIARGDVDRADAIEALLSLEKRLLLDEKRHVGADKAALSELANDLAKADEALAGALSEQDPKAAAEALAALAKRLEAQSVSERARLKEALDRIKRKSEASEARRKREAELESLLKRKPATAAQTPDEKRLLERNKRELERLRRENQTAREQSRELSRLQRDLAQAGQELSANSPDQASQAMQRGAEDLKRLGQEQGTREQREALAKQVAQLRELLQRQREQNNSKGQGQAKGQPGNSQAERTQRFVLRAGGKDPKGDDVKLRLPKPAGSGDEDKEGAPQQGSDKQAGKNGKPAFELGGDGPESAQIELPGMAQPTVAASPEASGEHDTRKLHDATELQSELRDSQLTGAGGKGPTRSEVILDAADRGFATASYRKVYSEYRSHAEEVLDKEDIPAGYRFYVRRYFQLVRPREERKAP